MWKQLKKFWCRVVGHDLFVVVYDDNPYKTIHVCKKCKARGTYEQLGCYWAWR